MTEEARKMLIDMISEVNGLYCILITDRDGVPLLKVGTDKTPDHAVKPTFIATFGLAIDQGSKLGLGKTNTLICSYSHYQVIQMNKLPLMATFITSASCNTGHVLALEQQLEPILSQLTLAVAES